MLLKGDSGLTSRPEEYPAEYYLQFLFTFKLWLTEQRTLVLNLHSTVLPSIAKTYRRKKKPNNKQTGLLQLVSAAVVCVHVLE